MRSRTFEHIQIMNVEYSHLVLPGGDDLYLTPYGLPIVEHLTPDNYFTDLDWQARNRRPLSGTSCVYYALSKPIQGQSRELVLKWNRMGQDIPGRTGEIDFDCAEFNTPFEEFSLVYELRDTRYESPGSLYTQRPLAIYVPNENVDLERLGRKAYRIKDKQRQHEEIQLYSERRYAVIYQWIRGIDAYQAWQQGMLTEQEMHSLYDHVANSLGRKGFAVADHKSTHIIVRPTRNGDLKRDRAGQLLHAYVDFELLRRTSEREAFIRARNRRDYLQRQPKRFSVRKQIPPHLHQVTIMGVDYIHRPIQSTGGALWVAGRDPDLFEYFLPEKWRRTPQTRLSTWSQIYQTCTKDSINLVWRVSNLGEMPDVDPFHPEEQKIIEAGYNSPFEEFSLNRYLASHGISTTYPRAIYMTGSRTMLKESLCDARRYETHAHLKTPSGSPLLQTDRDYILIWGLWNGSDESLAAQDTNHLEAVNALQAMRQGMINRETYLQLMLDVQARLMSIGIKDLNLGGTHILLSLTVEKELVLNQDGALDYRICTFDLLTGEQVRPAYEPDASHSYS